MLALFFFAVSHFFVASFRLPSLSLALAHTHSLSVLRFLCSLSLSLSLPPLFLSHPLYICDTLILSSLLFLPSPSLLVVSVKLSAKQQSIGLSLRNTQTHMPSHTHSLTEATIHEWKAEIMARWPTVLFRYLAWDEHFVTVCAWLSSIQYQCLFAKTKKR